MQTFRTRYPNTCASCERRMPVRTLAARDPEVEDNRVFHHRCFYRHIGEEVPSDKKFSEKYGW